MERRNWSLESLNSLRYIDSLENENKAIHLEKWVEKYLNDNTFLDNIDLEVDSLNIFVELFYKNINFLKTYNKSLKKDIQKHNNIKKFLI